MLFMATGAPSLKIRENDNFWATGYQAVKMMDSRDPPPFGDLIQRDGSKNFIPTFSKELEHMVFVTHPKYSEKQLSKNCLKVPPCIQNRSIP